jgi:hypothetical protein
VAALVALASTACASQRAPGGSTTTTLPTTSGQSVVVASPARGEVQHSIAGKVTGVDRGEGRVTVETPDGSKLTLRLPPVALASVREGDPVSMNVTIGQPR